MKSSASMRTLAENEKLGVLMYYKALTTSIVRQVSVYYAIISMKIVVLK